MAKDYASNPKARFDYEILETIEGGLVLKGFEVKAVKTGKASIKGAYVKILNNKPCLIGATISPYQPNNTPANYDPSSSRQILLSKAEILKLIGLQKSQGVTLIPMSLYGKKGLIKISVAVARGKKKYDKRETLKRKDVQRSKERGIYEG